MYASRGLFQICMYVQYLRIHSASVGMEFGGSNSTFDVLHVSRLIPFVPILFHICRIFFRSALLVFHIILFLSVGLFCYSTILSVWGDVYVQYRVCGPSKGAADGV